MVSYLTQKAIVWEGAAPQCATYYAFDDVINCAAEIPH